MYTSYWGLSRRPFEERQESDLYFGAGSHQTARLKLRYLVDQRKGIAVLAGEHGLGKSLLTQVFEREANVAPVIRLLLPQLSAADTLAYFASRLGCDVSEQHPQHRLLRELEDKLASLKASGSHAVFVIDDAHLLDNTHLNALRLLLNLNESGRADSRSFSLVAHSCLVDCNSSKPCRHAPRCGRRWLRFQVTKSCRTCRIACASAA